MLLFLFWLMATFFSLSFLKTLVNNSKRRKKAEKYSLTLSNDHNTGKGLGKLIEELNFPLATFDCDKRIEAIRACLLEHQESIALFCTIQEVSTCFHNHFAMTGNFIGTEIVASNSLNNTSILGLYSANIVFRKNTDSTLTLLSTFPENKDHDFYIKDFVLRLKEMLK